MTSNEEWESMATLRPPLYMCVRRRVDCTDGEYEPMALDGRIDKDEWAHVPWSDTFVDIEGPARQAAVDYPLTRFKMMYDDGTLYVGAELREPKVWGTLTEKNSVLYHENDFEVFLNPDGSRHEYYELEINCLNTVWELLLHRPYKDGHSLVNPYNLHSLRSAVHVDGAVNSPTTTCVRWCIELSWSLAELGQFNTLRFVQSPSTRTAPRHPVATQIWRVNFSRVQYELETVERAYKKVAGTSEQNIVWAPTGVIDIHRPEKWGYVFFSTHTDLVRATREFARTHKAQLDHQMALERILDAVYYKQRAFHALDGTFASTLDRLDARFPTRPVTDLLQQPEAHAPVLTIETTRENERYVATVQSRTQTWHVTHDGRLWRTA
ncbi:hypothetical protein PsorP6_015946 [Peronosclerospora sorghi]|uniref:Uncharacterized protein n=1 Tax=Peronosclerospora sorghi TaxID=230839 RepID=A0ACC0WN21_9STRA|nr:hypothetical protein PsorP6_015946 [Peronosclerospora sorghi]